MAVHAHPDEGMQTVLVTCTNGELGDGPGHVKPDEDGHDAKEVAKTRIACSTS